MSEFWKDVFALLGLFAWIIGLWLVGVAPFFLMHIWLSGPVLLLALIPGFFLMACYLSWTVR